jgi:hypothetical protein
MDTEQYYPTTVVGMEMEEKITNYPKKEVNRSYMSTKSLLVHINENETSRSFWRAFFKTKQLPRVESVSPRFVRPLRDSGGDQE